MINQFDAQRDMIARYRCESCTDRNVPKRSACMAA
jgi:hypothetical protein